MGVMEDATVPVATPVDDLGHPVHLEAAPIRIISLVPSLTEALAATAPDRLIAATDWCSHPADLAVARVRGTKNPDHRAIASLRPDLVVANQEENRRVDVERLRASGVAVWVTAIESVGQALDSMRRLITEGLELPTPGWLEEARTVWSAPPGLPPLRTVTPIWRDPWMVVGPATFSGDVLRRLGLRNGLTAGDDRYPKVTLTDLVDLRPDLVLLPDEPYAFTPDDGPEAFPEAATVLVSGRALTWYGPSMVTARDELVTPILASGASPR